MSSANSSSPAAKRSRSSHFAALYHGDSGAASKSVMLPTSDVTSGKKRATAGTGAGYSYRDDYDNDESQSACNSQQDDDICSPAPTETLTQVHSSAVARIVPMAPMNVDLSTLSIDGLANTPFRHIVAGVGVSMVEASPAATFDTVEGLTSRVPKPTATMPALRLSAMPVRAASRGPSTFASVFRDYVRPSAQQDTTRVVVHYNEADLPMQTLLAAPAFLPDASLTKVLVMHEDEVDTPLAAVTFQEYLESIPAPPDYSNPEHESISSMLLPALVMDAANHVRSQPMSARAAKAIRDYASVLANPTMSEQVAYGQVHEGAGAMVAAGEFLHQLFERYGVPHMPSLPVAMPQARALSNGNAPGTCFSPPPGAMGDLACTPSVLNDSRKRKAAVAEPAADSAPLAVPTSSLPVGVWRQVLGHTYGHGRSPALTRALEAAFGVGCVSLTITFLPHREAVALGTPDVYRSNNPLLLKHGYTHVVVSVLMTAARAMSLATTPATIANIWPHTHRDITPVAHIMAMDNDLGFDCSFKDLCSPALTDFSREAAVTDAAYAAYLKHANRDPRAPITARDLRAIAFERLDVATVREARYSLDLMYVSANGGINCRMRAILLDWLGEVCHEFLLCRDTYHLAVMLVDTYLSVSAVVQRKKNFPYVGGASISDQLDVNTLGLQPGDFPPVTRENLQLLGITCLSLASKLEEVHPPSRRDFIVTTDNAYTPADMAQLEMLVLKIVQWRLAPHTPYAAAKLLVKLLVQESVHRYHEIMSPDPDAPTGVGSFLATPAFSDGVTPLPVRAPHPPAYSRLQLRLPPNKALLRAPGMVGADARTTAQAARQARAAARTAHTASRSTSALPSPATPRQAVNVPRPSAAAFPSSSTSSSTSMPACPMSATPSADCGAAVHLPAAAARGTASVDVFGCSGNTPDVSPIHAPAQGARSVGMLDTSAATASVCDISATARAEVDRAFACFDGVDSDFDCDDLHSTSTSTCAPAAADVSALNSSSSSSSSASEHVRLSSSAASTRISDVSLTSTSVATRDPGPIATPLFTSADASLSQTSGWSPTDGFDLFGNECTPPNKRAQPVASSSLPADAVHTPTASAPGRSAGVQTQPPTRPRDPLFELLAPYTAAQWQTLPFEDYLQTPIFAHVMESVRCLRSVPPTTTGHALSPPCPRLRAYSHATAPAPPSAFTAAHRFSRLMEVLDAALLDSEQAFFFPSTLATAAIALIYPESRTLMPQLFHQPSLTPALLFLSRFLSLPFEAVGLPPKPYFVVQSLPHQMHTRQTHHSTVLASVTHLLTYPVRFSFILSPKLVALWNEGYFGFTESTSEQPAKRQSKNRP